MTTPIHFAKLSENERRLLAAWLAAFDQGWDEGRLAEQMRLLPPAGSPLRQVALKELIKIDLRRQWQRGEQRLLERYLSAYPELGTPQTVPVDLIQGERSARLAAGHLPEAAEYLRRFPRQAEALRRRRPADRKPREPVLGISVPTAPLGPRPATAAPPARPTRARGRKVWPCLLAVGGLGGVLLLGLATVAVALVSRGVWQPPPALANLARQAGADLGPSGEAAAAPDPDYFNDRLTPLDDQLVTVKIDLVAEVDVKGDARTRFDLTVPPALYAAFRRTLTSYVQVAGRAEDRPPLIANFLRLCDFDAEPCLIEGLGGEFGEEAVHVNFREIGFARHEDGRWAHLLTSDPAASVELVAKEASQKVTLREVKKLAGVQIVTQAVYQLPPGAHNIEVASKPSRLLFRLPPPAAGSAAGQRPALQVQVKPLLLSVLAKQYANLRFAKLWAARATFRNAGGETLTDYRVRFRVNGFSDWSGWARSDVVYPGQTVVDDFHPVQDGAKVRDLTGAAPADVEVEYEYVRAGGQKVTDTQTARTRLLGMNEGVFSDVEFGPDVTWFELFKDAPLVLASFTSANDPVIQELAGRIARSLGAQAGRGVSPTRSDREALLFLEALYNVMRGNIAYESARANVLDGLLHQHLKYARDVLRDRSGTCINTSIFYASGAEAAGLDAYLILIPGHCFAAARLPKSNQLVFVETTGCGGGTPESSAGFTAVCRVGAEEFKKATAAGRFLQVNIAEQRREGITPPELPPLGPSVLDDWKIVIPDAVPERSATTDRPAVGGASATAEIVRREQISKDEREGLAYHVRVRIRDARDRPCEVWAVLLDENGKPVRSRSPDCGLGEEQYLVIRSPVTPPQQTEELDDVVLFLPLAALPAGDGEQRFVCAVQVYCDGKVLVKDPPTAEITLTP